jgi:hypothetical protein
VRDRLVAAALGAALVVYALPGAATETPIPVPENVPPKTPADTALSDEAIERRIAFIEERLDGSRLHGQAWYWSWMAINGGSAVALGIVAGTSNHRDDKVNNAVQAGLGAIGVADLLLRPLEARHGAAPISNLPQDTREEKVAKLRAAEAQLHRNALRSEQRTSWEQHIGNVGINGAAGLAIALAGKQADGLIAFLTGVAGGELQIWSQPWQPARDWKAYHEQFDGQANRARMSVFLSPAAYGGARAGVRWDW